MSTNAPDNRGNTMHEPTALEAAGDRLAMALTIARLHISNLDPRCAEFGDWSRDGWNLQDEGGKRCNECSGCARGAFIEDVFDPALKAWTEAKAAEVSS